jgi:hypothetical protein
MTEPRQPRTAASDELLSITDVCAELGIARATSTAGAPAARAPRR